MTTPEVPVTPAPETPKPAATTPAPAAPAPSAMDLIAQVDSNLTLAQAAAAAKFLSETPGLNAANAVVLARANNPNLFPSATAIATTPVQNPGVTPARSMAVPPEAPKTPRQQVEERLASIDAEITKPNLTQAERDRLGIARANARRQMQRQMNAAG